MSPASDCTAADGTASTLAHLGRCLLLVPHPDDETIACGGLLCLLACAGLPVKLLLLSDGAGSHPNSRAFPPARLRDVRLQEMQAALHVLGHVSQHLDTLNLPDGAVPLPGEAGFGAALDALTHAVAAFGPDTVFMPVADDGHRDHRATHALGQGACARAALRALLLGYAVWLGAGVDERPQSRRDIAADGHLPWVLDIRSVLPQKLRALACHQSQLGLLVHDDPTGFVLPAQLRARCAQGHESFVHLKPTTAP